MNSTYLIRDNNLKRLKHQFSKFKEVSENFLKRLNLKMKSQIDNTGVEWCLTINISNDENCKERIRESSFPYGLL